LEGTDSHSINVIVNVALFESNVGHVTHTGELSDSPGAGGAEVGGSIFSSEREISTAQGGGIFFGFFPLLNVNDC
jgi:hypothetical protein